ncbi:hypothetical protein M0813_17174 [Anaeramoeba flamelloides]|uniref:Uncharacterized protein n=1 Tax=Anaeramoeba flamelloides TaxID=1746091 RepID=A0ABQ8YXE3_9EUKA|nr:hypothetical protein M0813_17174 [Anaeramoeba flamelloides]
MFPEELREKNLNKRKFSCRYNCNNHYKIELSRLIHEIIFHKRILVPLEKDIISKNVLFTKKKLYLLRSSLNSTLVKLKDRVSTDNKVKDKLNLDLKNQAFINLEQYIEEFENTYNIKKKIPRTKTLNINEGEYNGDIEIFKEVSDHHEINEYGEENFEEKDLKSDNELEEIEEILTRNNQKINDFADDDIFGIVFDKRLPSSFLDNTLLFETERDKDK